MTLQEFIEKTKNDAALNAKVNAAIMEKVIMPMAQAEGVELSDEELLGVAGGFGFGVNDIKKDHFTRTSSKFHAL